MNPQLLGAIIGIGSGLAVQVIVFFIKRGYFSLFNRFTENSLAGTWTSEYQEGQNIYHETIHVRQFGHTIYADATLTEEGKPTEMQKIKGTYKNQILTAEYWSTEKNVIERGTFTLRRVTSEKLEGFFTFFSGDPLQLQQSQYIWRYSK